MISQSEEPTLQEIERSKRLQRKHIQVQSAKILLMPPQYEIIMLTSNYSFFQYCDSNIGLFSIAPSKVITLNPLWYQVFATFLMALSLKLSLFQLSR
jgi:hypothetical protein